MHIENIYSKILINIREQYKSAKFDTMDTKKNQMIGFRLSESLKETLGRIAGRETRSVSQQVEHFVKQGITNYIKENPEFDSEKKPIAAEKQNKANNNQ